MARRALSNDAEFHREDTEELARLVLELGTWLQEQELFRKQPPHPSQPIVRDRDGIVRFRRNHIVRVLLDHSTKLGLGLNELVELQLFSNEDFEQLYQLIGTSVSAYRDRFPYFRGTLQSPSQ